MKYLILFTFSLILFSCYNPEGAVSNEVTDNAVERAKAEETNVQQDATKTVETTIPAIAETAEEMTEQGEGLLRGTFMYYADSATFTECETGEKFRVAGDDYLALEKEYMKQRTKDFEKIYVEVKGEIKMMVGMEGTKKVKTLVVDEMVSMDATKSCN